MASALGLDDSSHLSRYVRYVSKQSAPVGTVCLYEHPVKKQFALHGTACIALAAAMHIGESRGAETLPNGDDPIDTLVLSPRMFIACSNVHIFLDCFPSARDSDRVHLLTRF